MVSQLRLHSLPLCWPETVGTPSRVLSASKQRIRKDAWPRDHVVYPPTVTTTPPPCNSVHQARTTQDWYPEAVRTRRQSAAGRVTSSRALSVRSRLYSVRKEC